jgi:hypothetical protein
VIELFAVPPGQDARFLAAWEAEAVPGVTLHRALRDDVARRFACVPASRAGGVLVIVEFDVPEGAEDRLATAWEAVREAFSTRQGFIAAELHQAVGVLRWSSPLMYQRATQALGDLVAAMPFAARAALYAPA